MFSAALSETSDWYKIADCQVFEVAEFVSVVKTELRPFLGILYFGFVQNIGITRQQLVVRAKYTKRQYRKLRVPEKD